MIVHCGLYAGSTEDVHEKDGIEEDGARRYIMEG
jgi:hypothetical protein